MELLGPFHHYNWTLFCDETGKHVPGVSIEFKLLDSL